MPALLRRLIRATMAPFCALARIQFEAPWQAKGPRTC